MRFEELKLHSQIASNIKSLGFETPTPIQDKAIPSVMDGRDIIGLAQTGTGKTAAFVIPMLENYINGPRRKVRGLIIAPTRELAEQINDVIHDIARHTGLHSTAIYGGTGFEAQLSALRHGVEMVVACPGRLLDHMRRRTINLTNVDFLVLDEADRLFDMGFMPDIRTILAQLPPRQTALFSATMPGPIRKLAHDILRDPVTIQIAHSMPVSSVAHSLYPVSQSLKTALLLKLLRTIERDSVLIFTRTKHRATRLAEQLQASNYPVTCLQGDLPQNKRRAAMEGFRSGKHEIMVATDIAARGIDVSSISHVINFDMPATVDAYTHRIGRTGRAASTGDAFTLVTRDDEPIVRAIEKVIGARIERRKLEGFDYSEVGVYRPPQHPTHGHRPQHPHR